MLAAGGGRTLASESLPCLRKTRLACEGSPCDCDGCTDLFSGVQDGCAPEPRKRLGFAAAGRRPRGTEECDRCQARSAVDCSTCTVSTHSIALVHWCASSERGLLPCLPGMASCASPAHPVGSQALSAADWVRRAVHPCDGRCTERRIELAWQHVGAVLTGSRPQPGRSSRQRLAPRRLPPSGNTQAGAGGSSIVCSERDAEQSRCQWSSSAEAPAPMIMLGWSSICLVS